MLKWPKPQNKQPIKVKSYNIANGEKGNLQTIKAMGVIAHGFKTHPLVRRIATQIVSHLPSSNYLDESYAIGEWVRRHVRYVKDPHDAEYLTDPALLLERALQGTAAEDCDGIALLTYTLLLSIGHRPKFRAIRYNSKKGPYNHIYVVDYEANGLLGGKITRLPIDGIFKNMKTGYEIKHMSGKEF